MKLIHGIFIALFSLLAKSLFVALSVSTETETDVETYSTQNTFTATSLEKARGLIAPKPKESLNAESEDALFWETNGNLIRQARLEFDQMYSTTATMREKNETFPLTFFNSTLQQYQIEKRMIDETLYDAIQHMYELVARGKDIEEEEEEKELNEKLLQDSEDILRDSLFIRVAPDVYQCSLFTDYGVSQIRSYLNMVKTSGIPTRRPNGMNRYGIILQEEHSSGSIGRSSGGTTMIDGSVSQRDLSLFYHVLVRDFVRPLSRMLFPKYLESIEYKNGKASSSSSNDVESYGFTIQYDANDSILGSTSKQTQETDQKLNEHTDASLYTMNVNLNLPEEYFEGSAVYFRNGIEEKNNATGKMYYADKFTTGTALFHRGLISHAAEPIKKGTRQNLVVWLMGKDGYVRAVPYDESKDQLMSVQDRWTRSFKNDDDDGTENMRKGDGTCFLGDTDSCASL
eukprot:CAMPEP_0178967752 /NCGR_PEP_ID=MMETSP0789-20121207/17803_1 /TAXON_ID=3005 /ORGANISM="Rhizosolenia setigera, Strain CCMP 1694" /LENGTH=456 /DNA_ID=CAMNT_0020653465 /DNA_START=60 /DNA_END=1430 /DNA_ORIENTATION=-